MKFGMMYELEVPKPWSERSEYDVFHEAVEQAVFAEKMGFEYVWLVEHHFLEQFAHSSAPEVWLAYVAALTKTIRCRFKFAAIQFVHASNVGFVSAS